MPAIATSKFRIHNAEQFKEAFDETSNTIMYLFVGRNQAFPDDNSPPTPVNSTANVEFTPWRDMIGAKRIQASDVTHAISRYNWTSGNIYDYYDDQDTNLIESDDFYVITDDYNIYKCLWNAGATASTTKPTGTSTSKFTTADGYIWKYMYTVSTASALKFLTNDYIPVQTLSSDDGSDQWDVQSAAVDGGIDVIEVTSGGSGYTDGANTIATITGDGTGATANVTVDASNVVTAVTVTSVGSGYTSANVQITGGGGTGALATAIIGPKGGHGANAVEELGGKYIMLNVRLDGGEANTITTANEFRQVGIVRDPFDFGTSSRGITSNYRQTFRYTLGSVSGTFSADEIISDGASNTAVVVEYDSTNQYLYTLKPLPNDFANASSISGGTSNATATIIAINTPGLQPYSGDIIYFENRVPIARAEDQIEDIKLVIQF